MLRLSRFTSGFALGFGAGLVTRDLLAPQDSWLRPLFKGAVENTSQLADKAKLSFAQVAESIEDWIAEWKGSTGVGQDRPAEQTEQPLTETEVEPSPSSVLHETKT